MKRKQFLDIVIFGLSITSSWGNGHAGTYRALVKALRKLGHRVLFLERDQPWYRQNQDLGGPSYCDLMMYHDIKDLSAFRRNVVDADLVIVGSYVPEGQKVSEWILNLRDGVTAFYDIDTPVTLECLRAGSCEYTSLELIKRFDLILSFTGGPTLQLLEKEYDVVLARALYCTADPEIYRPVDCEVRWDLGYMGGYTPDRQDALEELLFASAEKLPRNRFVVAGGQYPQPDKWPPNVDYIEHISPEKHHAFYNAQRFTLNITGAPIAALGYSPSARIFESASCGVPVISDPWLGLESFFKPNEEILVAEDAAKVVKYLTTIDAEKRDKLGARARSRFTKAHSPVNRAKSLEKYFNEAQNAK